jgi:hypothetical protein
MNIKSVKKHNNIITGELDSYILIKNDDEKTWFVPLVEDNTDYQEIQQWVAEGNTIEEAD